ncbi:sigma-B regulation protein RsbQ [Roseivivax lentus]|uniref:Sigma-B regulation protein RsbQ n=1 Tax=Roseivivax lentus TaxID=633194 RepID=A0A1N7NT91_9RHOB|nr:alpha/beta hydrolase [Roseivivax lentus]SIT01506.1 sigma-B regulation protein RsbQ [Roseivivax lentus]
MVFAHGFGCDQTMWRHVAPQFADRFTVVTFDYVGAGGSDVTAYDPDRYRTLDGYAQDVVEIGHALDLNDAIFVGHSVSAMIGALAAIRAPAMFGTLVMVCPSPRYVDDVGYPGGFSQADIDELIAALEENPLAWSASMAPAIMGTPDQPMLGAELTESFCRLDPRIASDFARAIFSADNRADLPKVAARTLILQCRQDILASEAIGAYVRDHVPDSEMVVLDATGHCPNLSAPDQVVAAMRAFL